MSEKATNAAEKNQVVFKVLRDATKPEIQAAVELLFKVEVVVLSTRRRPCSGRFGWVVVTT